VLNLVTGMACEPALNFDQGAASSRDQPFALQAFDPTWKTPVIAWSWFDADSVQNLVNIRRPFTHYLGC
jgi:hypothetical protein